MARGGTARRTNGALVLATAMALLLAGAAAVFGERRVTPSTGPTTTAPERPQVDGTGIRPADVARSWFDHGTAREQFDYSMNALSCDELAKYMTLDLCAVATAESGSFMLVGTESFWDPDDTDADGISWVPFDLTVFTMRRDAGARAVSVLDGYTEKAYSRLKAQLDLYRAEVNGDEVLVLVKRLAPGAGDAYDYTESVQVLAASGSGAPTLVASYEGANVQVASTGRALVVTSLRYGPPGDPDAEGNWFSKVTLTPSTREPYAWDETITSGTTEGARDAGMTLLGTYTFPVGKGTSDPQTSNA